MDSDTSLKNWSPEEAAARVQARAEAGAFSLRALKDQVERGQLDHIDEDRE
jgi:hypothetical protein